MVRRGGPLQVGRHPMSNPLGRLMKAFQLWMAIYFPLWPVRRAFYRRFNVRIGSGTMVSIGTVIRKNTVIGNNCWIGNECVLEGFTTIGNNVRIESQCHITSYSLIEDDVFIGPMFASSNDNRLSYSRRGHGQNLKGVTIRARARIGGGAMTLPGITIGEGAIVGALSLVTKDVRPFALVYGVPAKEREDKSGLLNEQVRDLDDGSE